MPLLRVHSLPPIVDAAAFSIGATSCDLRGESPPRPAQDQPCATDAEAIANAKRWLVEHFGALSPGSTLHACEIMHSASGNDVPRYDWDLGHTITFEQCWQGIPTDGFAVVYVQGRSKFSGSFRLYAIAPEPASAKVPITAAEAARLLNDMMRQMPPEQTPSPPVLPSDLQLRYLAPGLDEAGASGWLLRPYWVVSDRRVVDAFTGGIEGRC